MGSPQIVQAFSVNCTGKPCKSNLQVKPCILEITGILRNYYILFLKKLHGMSLYLQTLYKFRVCTCKVPVIPCKGLQCSAQCSKDMKLKNLDVPILQVQSIIQIIPECHELKFLKFIIGKCIFYGLEVRCFTPFSPFQPLFM